MSIERKVEQMYRALAEMKVISQPTALPIKSRRTATSVSLGINLDKIADDVDAANRASQLLNNIACLKDHLKVWCQKNAQPFGGDTLIDSNREVAVVHDLWNLDKHGKLDRSRSGLYPIWKDPPRSAIELKCGPGTPESGISVEFFSGSVQTTGDVGVSIVATVADKDGNVLGSFEKICEKAVDGWKVEFKKVGLNI